MVKHTQQPTNCLSVFDHFVGLTLKRLNGENEAKKNHQPISHQFHTLFYTPLKRQKTRCFQEVSKWNIFVKLVYLWVIGT